MPFKPKDGYKLVLDPLTKLYHYIPETGRPHQFDKCWCHPFHNERTGSVHHNLVELSKAIH